MAGSGPPVGRATAQLNDRGRRGLPGLLLVEIQLFLFSFPGPNSEHCKSEIARASGYTGSTHHHGHVVKRVLIAPAFDPLCLSLEKEASYSYLAAQDHRHKLP